MTVSTDQIKELRSLCGAGIMECRMALVESEGKVDKALAILKEKGLVKAKKAENRTTGQGIICAYVHMGGRIGAMVEIKCETDFVARTDEFKELGHNLAMQIAACPPKYLTAEDLPQNADDLDPKSVCLLVQPYIKDPARTVKDIVTDTIAKTGENIRVTRFARFELGE